MIVFHNRAGYKGVLALRWQGLLSKNARTERFAQHMRFIQRFLRFSLFPIGEKVEDEKIDIQTRRRMCEIIVGCFEGDKKLSDRIVSEIEALQNFIGKDYSLVDSLAPPNFDYFNGKLLEINKAINGELKNHVSSDLDNLNQQLSKEFEKMESFEYDESLDFTHARKVKIPPITRRVTRDDVV